MRNDGPAIVTRGFDDVDLIASLGSMLMRPDLPCFRMDCHALDITITQGEFLGLSLRPVHKWIIFGHAAIVVQTNDRAGVILKELRACHFPTITQGEIHIACLIKDNTPTKMVIRTSLRLHAKEYLHVGHLVTDEFAARQCGTPSTFARLTIGKIDPSVFRILRMQDHIK